MEEYRMSENLITPDLLNAFNNALAEDEKRRNTIDKYMHDVRVFVDFAKGKVIDKHLALAYKENLGNTYALSSANSMIASLNSFFRIAGWQECCLKQFKIQRKTFCSENAELSRAEYVALINTAERRKDGRLSLLIQTICGTGIRVSELSCITLEAVLKGEAIVSCKGKTRKVFIISALRKKLLRYAKTKGIKSGMIFVTKNGRALDRSNIWRDMKSLCEAAGVAQDKVFPHNLRHLFARTFYEIEKDIVKLADILGHSNINTSRIYVISTGAEHKRKLERMRLII